MDQADRRKTIWRIGIFSLLVTLVAWVAPLLGGSPNSPGPGFVLWGTAPLVVSLLIRLVTHDWADLGIKPAFSGNLRWYLFSVAIYPAVMVLTLLIDVLISVASVSEFSMGKYLQTALTARPVFFIFAIFEEVGWRGYLAPKLTSLRLNHFVASALVAVVWTAWHIPYLRDLLWIYDSAENLVTFIPRYLLLLFVLSIVYGKIRHITGTFWPVVLMHAASNAIGHPLAAEYMTIPAGKEFLASVSTGLIAIVLFGLLGVALSIFPTDARSNKVRTPAK